MNKNTLLFLFFFSFSITFAQKDDFKKPNTLMPSGIEDHSDLQKLHRAFLPNKNKITKKNILTTGTVVDSVAIIGNNTIKYLYEYNSNGKMVLRAEQKFKGNEWINSYQAIYNYDDRNNKILKLGQYWKNEEWVNSDKETYAYDDRNNMILELWQKWVNEAWVNIEKITYVYDDRDNMILRLGQDWENEAWVNYLKNTYAYDDRNNMILELYQEWGNEAWVNLTKSTYAFDDRNNNILELWQDWENEAWVNYLKNTYAYTYDSNGNITYFSSSSFSLGYGVEFQDIFNNKYFFHVYGSGGEGYIYYKTITDIKEEKALVTEFKLEQNYPNPFNPSTTINYTIPKEEHVSLIIYNSLGEKIQTLINENKRVGSYNIDFNAANLPSGIYFYRLITGSFSKTKKMILLK